MGSPQHGVLMQIQLLRSYADPTTKTMLGRLISAPSSPSATPPTSASPPQPADPQSHSSPPTDDQNEAELGEELLDRVVSVVHQTPHSRVLE
jgi:hypothetical protein